MTLRELIRDRVLWVVLGIAGVVYAVNACPYGGWHDSLSYLSDAEAGFNFHANATNHFLYNNMQHFLHEMLFFLPLRGLLQTVTIIFALLTLARLYQAGRLFGGPYAAGAATLAFAFSFTFWQQTEIIEVYAMNSYLFSSYFYLALADMTGDRRRRSALAGLYFGLALLTHIQHILALPFMLSYLVWGRDWARRTLGLAFIAGSFLFLLMMAYVYKDSLHSIFFDRHFGDEAMGIDLGGWSQGIGIGLLLLVYNLHLLLPLVAVGAWGFWKAHRGLMLRLLLLFLPFAGFASKFGVVDAYVFYIIPYMVLCLMAVKGINLLSERRRRLSMIAAAVAGPLIYLTAWQVAGKVDHPKLKAYDERAAYKGGAAHLFWPGKRGVGAQDPLVLAAQWKEGDPLPEWNLIEAQRFLLHYARNH